VFSFGLEMVMKNLKLYFSAAVALLASSAWATPVGFKGSVMSMGELGRDAQELQVIYSFTARDAVGAGASNMRYTDRASNAQHRFSSADLHYNRLLARWNLPDAQANIYALFGLGAARGNFFSGTQAVAQPGLQLDYETRRIYLASAWHGSYASAFKGASGSVSAGFSFYPTEYDEWQPWMIVKAKKMFGDFRDATELTPSLRLIHKTFFVEVGTPFKRGQSEGLNLNFRYTF
jgi:hypothetical protein